MARPKSKPPAEKPDRESAIAIVAKMLVDASVVGRPVTSSMVMNAVGVSKPTALSYLRAAQDKVALQGAQAVATHREEVGQPAALEAPPLPPRQTLDQEQALAVGIDMAGTLRRVKESLEATLAAILADLAYVRWVVMGGHLTGELPTRCPECNKALKMQFEGRSPGPHLLGPNALPAFGKLYAELIKANKGVIDVVGEQNDVLEQFYNFASVQRFMSHTEQAIRELCDADTAKAIARRVRELGSQG